ncbi:Type 2 lactosamine alpha-2,3-sialyltransferase [Acipenser ruthenus]|uniref:Type 2 lactosamine alpha-2,3-sialyltransferase n=1 Tax=Acipenser ruthenus TaxID=7906 RepID=A0A444UEL5_ACIRT|nr:Type 2 lactosamine alpha-2,3-sialyltransferase [Acipenser ruthenus]
MKKGSIKFWVAVMAALSLSCSTFILTKMSFASHRNKCRKCVVVGNGAVLRNKTLGKIIDSFEVVIRINSGPVRGYESDVGKRTTFRLCYPESIFKDSRDADPNTTVVIIPFKPHDLRWMTEVLQKKPVIPTHPTSGIIAITMALNVCENVYIAGFKYNLSSNNYLHYYGKELMFEMRKVNAFNIDSRHIFKCINL